MVYFLIYYQSNYQQFHMLFELLLWRSFQSICYIFFSMVNRFLAVFTTLFFTHTFTTIFANILSKRQKSILFQKYSISRLNWIKRHFVCVIFYLQQFKILINKAWVNKWKLWIKVFFKYLIMKYLITDQTIY